MNPFSLIIFALVWIMILYVFNSFLVGHWKKVEVKKAVLYFTTVSLIGIYGEIFLDTTYKFFVGHPLWRYNILPIHMAYTSAFAVVVWGIYGFHLYLLHGTLDSKWSINKTKHLVLIFSFEALLLEAMITISAKLLLGKYLYYYLPADLWHVSSFQNLPFYMICGFLILRTIKRFKDDPIFFSTMNIALLFVVVTLI